MVKQTWGLLSLILVLLFASVAQSEKFIVEHVLLGVSKDNRQSVMVSLDIKHAQTGELLTCSFLPPSNTPIRVQSFIPRYIQRNTYIS